MAERHLSDTSISPTQHAYISASSFSDQPLTMDAHYVPMLPEIKPPQAPSLLQNISTAFVSSFAPGFSCAAHPSPAQINLPFNPDRNQSEMNPQPRTERSNSHAVSGGPIRKSTAARSRGRVSGRGRGTTASRRLSNACDPILGWTLSHVQGFSITYEKEFEKSVFTV